jgi:hypothetical protein
MKDFLKDMAAGIFFAFCIVLPVALYFNGVIGNWN